MYQKRSFLAQAINTPFLAATNRAIIAIDNVTGSVGLGKVDLPKAGILVFGSESSGLSEELLARATQIVEIEQFGSTRSINVASAAAIAMYAWLQQHKL